MADLIARTCAALVLATAPVDKVDAVDWRATRLAAPRAAATPTAPLLGWG